VLKCLQLNDYEHLLTNDACRWATIGGHLEILQWLLDNGCFLDISVYKEATNNGRLHILKWLL